MRGKEGVSEESMRRNTLHSRRQWKTCHRLVEVVLLLEGSAVTYGTCGHDLGARKRQRGRSKIQIARQGQKATNTAVS